MSEIRDIVDVQITRGTRTITREGFGTALVLVGLTDGVATKGFRVKTYSNIQGVAEDFATSDFAYKAAVAYFGATPSPKFLKVGIFDDGTSEADTDYSDALLKIASVDNGFYGLVADTRDPLVVAALADTVASLEKIYITSSASVTILDPLDNTDIGTVLKLGTQERTSVVYSNDTASAPEAGWFGKMFPTDAGSATWAFKNLVGITADQLSSTQAEAAFAKNVNTYEYIAGQNVTRYGTVATGEYIDQLGRLAA